MLKVPEWRLPHKQGGQDKKRCLFSDQPSYASWLSIRVVCQSCVFDVIQPLLVTKSSKPFSKTCCASHVVFGAEGSVWRKVGEVLACVAASRREPLP